MDFIKIPPTLPTTIPERAAKLAEQRKRAEERSAEIPGWENVLYGGGKWERPRASAN